MEKLQPEVQKDIKNYPLGTGDEIDVLDWIKGFREKYELDNNSEFVDTLSYNYNSDDYDGYKPIVVDSWGGEGEGDNIGYTIQVKHHSGSILGYFNINGSYNSWDGANRDYMDITVVKPVEVLTVIFKWF